MLNIRARPFHKVARLINRVVSSVKSALPAGLLSFNTPQSSQYVGIL